MGTIRRLKKSLHKPHKAICLAKTGLTFEGCDIMLVVGNREVGAVKSGRFRTFLHSVVSRSVILNIGDIMDVSLLIRSRLLSGEAIWN